MATIDQLKFFVGAKNLKTSSQKLFKFYNFNFRVVAPTKIMKSEIIHISQSHYPTSINVQVILL